jgi:hypothetical protein
MTLVVAVAVVDGYVLFKTIFDYLYENPEKRLQGVQWCMFGPQRPNCSQSQ